MAKLDRRVAYYDDGRIIEGKTDRKSFKSDGLIGIARLYSDGTREAEDTSTEIEQDVNTEETFEAKIARLRFEAQQQFKHDGGDTPEIVALLEDSKSCHSQQ